MKTGDDSFNARDFAAMNAVHHPGMIVHLPGIGEPLLGRDAHAAAMRQMFEMFPDVQIANNALPSSSEAASG